MGSAKFHNIFKKSHSSYTCLVEMLNASVVGIFSIMIEMSECSIHNDKVVESQWKNSQYHFMLLQIKFSKKNQIIYPDWAEETDSVDLMENFKKYYPLY